MYRRRRRMRTIGVRTQRRGRYIIKTVYKRVMPRRRRRKASGFKSISKYFGL